MGTMMALRAHARGGPEQTFPLPEGQQAFESGAGPRRPGKTVLVVR